MRPNLFIFCFCLLTFGADITRCINLICEDGYRPGTHFYHLGDGGYCYHASDESLSSVYFKCVLYDKGCRGRAIYRYSGHFIKKQAHNHRPDPDFVGARHFRQNLLNQIHEGRYVNFQEVVDQFRSDKNYSRNIRKRMTLPRLRSSMNRTRSNKYPLIPPTLRELTKTLLNNPNVVKTVDKTESLYAGSVTATDGSHHVAFFSPRMLRFMANCKIIQGDGTFKSKPTTPACSQIFALVTTWNSFVVPLGWFLMESRTIPAYTAIFGLLKHLCPDLNPEVIISDFEYSQQAAWQRAFPNADVQGCLWHLCRAFVRKAKKLGIYRYRTLLPNLDSYIHKASAISLLPRRYFMAGLRVLRAEALREDVIIAHQLEPFFDYVETKWIKNNARKYWMSFFEKEYRTNNSAECHNRMLRDKVHGHHPNVYMFIQALAILENNASLDSELEAEGGNARRARRWKSVVTDIQLKKLAFNLKRQLFHNMDEIVLNYINRAARLFESAYHEHVRNEVPKRNDNVNRRA